MMVIQVQYLFYLLYMTEAGAREADEEAGQAVGAWKW